jgi:hypothetical protein
MSARIIKVYVFFASLCRVNWESEGGFVPFVAIHV